MPSNGKVKPKKEKGFFGKMIEKLDKKMEEKSKKTSCCEDRANKDKGSPCC